MENEKIILEESQNLEIQKECENCAKAPEVLYITTIILAMLPVVLSGIFFSPTVPVILQLLLIVAVVYPTKKTNKNPNKEQKTIDLITRVLFITVVNVFIILGLYIWQGL